MNPAALLAPRLDGLSGPVALLLALRFVAVVSAAPRAGRAPAVVGRKLAALALSLGACVAPSPALALALALAAALAGRHALALPLVVAQLPLVTVLLIRFVGPLVPQLAPRTQVALAAAAVALSLYGALSALAQSDLRRLVRALGLTQLGFVLAGVSTGAVHGCAGAEVEGLSSGLTLAGLGLTVATLGARTGTVDVRALGGLVRGCGRMTAMFLLLGVASVGFPATLAFVGEDLLLHGLLDAHPLLAAVMLLATALGGIAMFRAWQRAFLGPADDAWRAVPDLLPRERASLFALVAAVVLAGLFPTRLVEASSAVAERVLAHAHHRAP